jgi:hypothetical protein
MFVFVFEGELFRFRLKTPAFASLFQFPPRMKASLLDPASGNLPPARDL